MQNFKRHTLSAVMAASLAAVALGACNRADRQEVRTEGREATATVGQAVDNATLTTRVKSKLLADDQVKGTQINVDSNNGVVTLTGTVDNPDHVRRAEELARDVDGVQRVENNLAAGNAAPGMVPGTQPPGTSPAATPLPNAMTPGTERSPGGLPTGTPGTGQPGTTAPAQPGDAAPATTGQPGTGTRP
jgi:hypothetical protein